LPDHFQQRQRAGNFIAVNACGKIKPRRCAVTVWHGALEPRPRTDLHRRKMAHRPARRARGLLNLVFMGNRIESRGKMHSISSRVD